MGLGYSSEQLCLNVVISNFASLTGCSGQQQLVCGPPEAKTAAGAQRGIFLYREIKLMS